MAQTMVTFSNIFPDESDVVVPLYEFGESHEWKKVGADLKEDKQHF